MYSLPLTRARGCWSAPNRSSGISEHLAAIALQTGRAKDKARLLQFVESGVLDAERFEAILGRYGLTDVWQRFARQFLGEKL